MKSTGIVRKVDELGRIVLPIELRRTLDIAEKDSIEIYVDGSSIILKKYEPTCVFCGDAKNITVYKGKNVCDWFEYEAVKNNKRHCKLAAPLFYARFGPIVHKEFAFVWVS